LRNELPICSVFFSAFLALTIPVHLHAAQSFTEILLEDTFETYDLGPLPASGSWTTVQPAGLNTKRRLEVMNDTNNLMGRGTNNQILFFQNIADKPWLYIVWTVADTLPASSTLKVSFDFYEPASSKPGGLTVCAGASPSAANAVNAFRLIEGTLEPAGSYTIDAPHHLDAFFNETGTSIDYYDPAGTVSTLNDGLMDLWIDGICMATGVTMERDSSPAPEITSLLFTSVQTNQEIYLDNLTIARLPELPEPVLSITNLIVNGSTARLEWNMPLDRFIVIGTTDLDKIKSNGLCVASSTVSTNAIEFPYDGALGFFLLRSGIAALESISSPKLIDAVREQSVSMAPANCIYDIDTAGIYGLQLPGGNFNPTELISFTNLQSLDLSGSGLTTIDDFSFLNNLTWLNLSSNRLTKTTGLAGMVNLEALDLQYNRISDLIGIESLTHLRWLDLEHNQISDLASVVTNAANGGLGEGDELWVRDNPLSAAATNQILILQTNYLINVYY